MSKSVLSIVLVLFCSATFVAMHLAGISARSEAPSVALSSGRFDAVLVERTTDLCRVWQERHVHGRTLVHLGRFLHSVGNDGERGKRMDTRDILQAGNLSHLLASPTTYRNFLLVAFEQNMIRQKYHVFSARDFKERFALQKPDVPSGMITDHDYGSRSFYMSRLPEISEPVLLNVDASFFHGAEVDDLLEMIQASSLKVDIVTFCLAADSSDVTEVERSKLRQALDRLGPGVRITRFGQSATEGRAK